MQLDFTVQIKATAQPHYVLIWSLKGVVFLRPNSFEFSFVFLQERLPNNAREHARFTELEYEMGEQ